MIRKKALFSVFEIPLMITLISFAAAFFTIQTQQDAQNFDVAIESFIDVIYLNDTYRSIIIDENLSNASITQNWTPLTNLIETNFLAYELRVANQTTSKTITTCNATYSKTYAERVISIKNLTTFTFRKIRLGVCY